MHMDMCACGHGYVCMWTWIRVHVDMDTVLLLLMVRLLVLLCPCALEVVRLSTSAKSGRVKCFVLKIFISTFLNFCNASAVFTELINCINFFSMEASVASDNSMK